MEHRHLNHQGITLAAIDDVIARGQRRDWALLRQRMLNHPSLSEKVHQVCRPKIVDPYAQRYHFWMHYVSYRANISSSEHGTPRKSKSMQDIRNEEAGDEAVLQAYVSAVVGHLALKEL